MPAELYSQQNFGMLFLMKELHKDKKLRRGFARINHHFGEGYLDLIRMDVILMNALVFARIYREENKLQDENEKCSDDELEVNHLKDKVVFLCDQLAGKGIKDITQFKI